ncbi:glycosyltransferase [Polaribacter sp. ALD11]|uniref:glycosyltransferase n=1 Tax=Polaribacter sp. ALD11 TaxID=2058137 RepID=UPI0012FD5A55|nr:glycosyltransferase [Polaribacter sp. ALD11]
MSIYSEPIEWIKESINSILNQTFTDFEFIIINDNPSRKENTELLKDYLQKDKRIQVIENKENIGLTKSLNKGVKIAKGKYIARMDADDISLLQRLKKQFDFMESNKDYIVCGSQISYFGDKIKSYSNWTYEDNNELKSQLVLNSCFAHPSVMIRKSVLFDNNIFYDENFKQAQDYKLWSDLSSYGKFYNIQEVLLKYRLSNQQVSKTKGTSQNKNGNRIRKGYIATILPKNIISIIENESLNLNNLKEIKEYLKTANLSKLLSNNIIFVIYLSINKNSLITLFYYFLSGDFFNNITTPGNILRVIENCILPNRKPSRL